MNIILGDANAKIWREEVFRLTIGIFSKHDETNENGQLLVDWDKEKNLITSVPISKDKSKQLGDVRMEKPWIKSLMCCRKRGSVMCKERVNNWRPDDYGWHFTFLSEKLYIYVVCNRGRCVLIRHRDNWRWNERKITFDCFSHSWCSPNTLRGGALSFSIVFAAPIITFIFDSPSYIIYNKHKHNFQTLSTYYYDTIILS